MGNDILAAGALGVLAVLVCWLGHDLIVRVCGWPRRYVRARGYELERAQHAARQEWAELERAQRGGVGSMDLAEETAYYASLPEWDPQSRRGALPAWAEPAADRFVGFGGASGSMGSDYGHGLPLEGWPAPGSGDHGHAGGAPGSEPSGVPGPAPLDLPPGWSQPALPFPDRPGDMPDDPAQDDTWARILEAWGDGMGAPSSDPGTADAPTSPPAGRGDGHRRPVGRAPAKATGAPAAVPVAGGGWEPVPPGIAFDACLAGQVARWIRDMDRDVANYLERLGRQ